MKFRWRCLMVAGGLILVAALAGGCEEETKEPAQATATAEAQATATPEAELSRPVTAREAYELALPRIREERPDAYLVWAEAGCSMLCEEDDLKEVASQDGRGEHWQLGFCSSEDEPWESTWVYVENGEIVLSREGVLDWSTQGMPRGPFCQSRHPLERFIDSTDAFVAAEARTRGSHLCGLHLDDYINGARWTVTYCPTGKDWSGSPIPIRGTGYTVDIDAQTGEFLRGEENEWDPW